MRIKEFILSSIDRSSIEEGGAFEAEVSWLRFAKPALLLS